MTVKNTETAPICGVRCVHLRIRILLFLTAFISGIPLCFSQNAQADSLQARFHAETVVAEKLDILEQMIDLAFMSDLNQALIYTSQGVALAVSSNDEIRKPKFFEMHGRMYANLLKLDSATLYFDKALAGYTAIDNKRGQATTLFKIGWVNKRKGNIQEAMNCDLKALRLMEELEDNLGIAGALSRVSEDLMIQGRPDEALEYALKSVSICETNNLDHELFYAYRGVGDAALSAYDFEKALKYYNKSRDLGLEIKIGAMHLADIINCRGNALKRLGRYEEALVAYKECLKFGKEANYRNGIAAVTANLGETTFLMGDFEGALPYQLATINMQEEDGNVSNLVENYNHAATIYGELGDYKSAWTYEKKARALHDSILSEKSDAVVSELRTQYETEKKEATIQAQFLQLGQRSKVQWLTAGAVILLAGFLFFLYRSYRIRTKTNILLQAKNKENELLLKEIHHRVKNNLEVVSSLLELQSAQIDNMDVKAAMLEGQNRVHSIGIVHQKLYMGTNLGAIEMKDYFLNLSESILDSFGAEDRVTIDCAMDRLDVDIDTAVPLGLIVNELLTNTLKYAFPDGMSGNVMIQLKKDAEGSLLLEVADNGVGKSQITQGTGFGSQLVSLLTSQLRGSMREEIINGTKIFFHFNLEKSYGG